MPLSEKSISGVSRFSYDVLTIVTGTTIAQLLTILFAPIITRLYGPEAFGLLAIFTSITSIFGVIVCLRYELAIMLPKSDEEAANVFGLCIIIIFIMSTLSIPLLFLSQKYIEQLFNAPQLGPFLLFIPPMIFLGGVFLVLNYWNTRTRQFHRLSIAQVTKSASVTGIQLGIGFIGYTSGGVLIGAMIFGQFVSTFILGIQIIRCHISFFMQHITMDGMFAVLKQYKNFPKYDIWSALLNTVTLMLPVFILTVYFNPTIVGYYAVGLMVLEFPLSFIEGAIAQVFFQKAAEAKNISHQKLKEIVLQTVKPLIFVVFFPAILLILIGPEIFSVIFGARWEEAGNYVRFLSLWIGIGFIASSISSLFSIFQKQRFTLIFNALQLISQIIALIVGALTGNALNAIILFSLVAFISDIVAYSYLLRLSGLSIFVPAKIVSDYFLISLPFILIVILIQRIFSYDHLLIVFLSLLIFTVSPMVVIKRDPELFSIFKGMTAQIRILEMIQKYLH